MSDNLKVGLGIITMGKRPLPDYHLAGEYALKVFADKDKKGPAFARNSLSKEFYDEGYDYWVIMDDDVLITQPPHAQMLKEMTDVAHKGNWDMFISPEYFRDKIKCAHQNGEVLEWEGGAFTQWMMISPKVVDTIGYMPILKYGYGYEDGLYIEQMRQAQREGKLNNGIDGVLMPAKMLAFIHPTDMFGDNTTSFHNMSAEEKLSQSKGNWDEYLMRRDDILKGNIYCPFQ